MINFCKAPEDCCYYRGEIFSLKLIKYRLAAGLRPDPLGGGAKALPRPPSRNNGPTSKGRGRQGGEGEGTGGRNLLQGVRGG